MNSNPSILTTIPEVTDVIHHDESFVTLEGAISIDTP